MRQIRDSINKIRDQIWEHEEIIKLRNRFTELDPKVQQGIMAGSIGLAASFMLGSLLYIAYAGYSTKSQIQEMNDEIAYIQSANERMELLRRQVREQSGDNLMKDIDKNAPLPTFAASVAQNSAISKENTEVNEKGGSIELKLNKISLRQLVRVLFIFENAKNGVNITKVETDSRNDPEGYLWAVIGLQKQVASNSAPGTNKNLFSR